MCECATTVDEKNRPGSRHEYHLPDGYFLNFNWFTMSAIFCLASILHPLKNDSGCLPVNETARLLLHRLQMNEMFAAHRFHQNYDL